MLTQRAPSRKRARSPMEAFSGVGDMEGRLYPAVKTRRGQLRRLLGSLALFKECMNCSCHLVATNAHAAKLLQLRRNALRSWKLSLSSINSAASLGNCCIA